MKHFSYLFTILFLLSNLSIAQVTDGTMDCDEPMLSVDNPDPICEGSSATLTVTTDGEEVHWFDSVTSTTPIYVGEEFVTPGLSENTSYWVKAVNDGGTGGYDVAGAREAPTNTASSAVLSATTPWGLSFDTYESFTIHSVDVYLASNEPGDLVIQLLDENWQVLDETTVSCPAGNSSNPVQFQAVLEFEVEADKTYRLVAASSPIMIREFTSSHPGFPYPLDEFGSVTGGTINNSHSNETVYYFFYNWILSVNVQLACESELEEVLVTVNPAPDTPEGEADQYFGTNDTLADLEVDAEGDLTWYADFDLTEVLEEETYLVDETTYYVTQSIDGCESEALAITVHLALGVNDLTNSAISIYPNPVVDILNINSKLKVDSVEVYDLSGRKVLSATQLVNGQLDMSNYAAGTYLIRIQSGSQIQNFKLIKR